MLPSRQLSNKVIGFSYTGGEIVLVSEREGEREEVETVQRKSKNNAKKLKKNNNRKTRN